VPLVPTSRYWDHQNLTSKSFYIPNDKKATLLRKCLFQIAHEGEVSQIVTQKIYIITC